MLLTGSLLSDDKSGETETHLSYFVLRALTKMLFKYADNLDSC